MVQTEPNCRSRIGHQYDRISSAFEPSHHMAADIFRLALRADEPRGLRVLDAGCGLGPTSVAFGRRESAFVAGVDLSYGSLAKGRGPAASLGLSNVHFQQMDLYHLGFVTGSFDLVFCQAVWPLVPDKRGVVEELARVCRPGGTVIVSFHARTWIDPIINAIRVVGCRLPEGVHMPLSRLACRL